VNNEEGKESTSTIQGVDAGYENTTHGSNSTTTVYFGLIPLLTAGSFIVEVLIAKHILMHIAFEVGHSNKSQAIHWDQIWRKWPPHLVASQIIQDKITPYEVSQWNRILEDSDVHLSPYYKVQLAEGTTY